MSKHSWISGHCLWILATCTSLVLLGALSRPYFQDEYSYSYNSSDTNFDIPIPLRVPSKGPSDPPVLAYWISGSHGDSKRMLRLLKAIYHPRNQYLLLLDAGSAHRERRKLALSVQSERVFRAFGNVNVVGRSYALNEMGASAVAATLHAAALLLKISADWDWFVTLRASDYPIVAQDDLLHAFSFLPRDVNFVHYTSNTGWKERKIDNHIVVDPSLYLKNSKSVLYANEKRVAPDQFKIFGGSPWVILSRAFTEHCIQGWDNLPRKLLMYFNNFIFPLELYFHTIICNSPEFQNTTVDSDLRYNIISDTTAPSRFNFSSYGEMVSNGTVFARPFKEDDPVLSELDNSVLNRPPDSMVPGQWCLDRGVNRSTGSSMTRKYNCSIWGDIDSVKPGSNGPRLETLFSKLVVERRLRANSCHNTV